ncbi:MAG: hypothetical protein DRI90_09595, partial [Deltaproteobacteria bacterium]
MSNNRSAGVVLGGVVLAIVGAAGGTIIAAGYLRSPADTPSVPTLDTSGDLSPGLATASATSATAAA